MKEKGVKMLKKLSILSMMFVVPTAFATSGIDCRSVDGTLEVFTEEAITDGDNVITLGVVAPWIQKEAISFSKLNEKNEVNVSRDEGGVIYMAQNSKGQSITLLLNDGERSNTKISTVYLKSSGNIYVETMVCSGADGE